MNVLVIQENKDLASIWANFLRRRGFAVDCALTSEQATSILADRHFDALIMDPAISGNGLSVADFATFRNPDIKILAVTASTFFSDGLVFNLIPNARGLLRAPVRPEDIAAYVEHFRDTCALTLSRRAAGGGA